MAATCDNGYVFDKLLKKRRSESYGAPGFSFSRTFQDLKL